MKIQYPYTSLRGKHLPLLPVVIRKAIKGFGFDTIALVDSGASISVFKPALAEQLGINIHKGNPILIETVNGKITIYIHKVYLSVAGHQFHTAVGFSEEYTASLNLLGREGFFEEFIVTLNEKNREIILEEYQK